MLFLWLPQKSLHVLTTIKPQAFFSRLSVIWFKCSVLKLLQAGSDMSIIVYKAGGLCQSWVPGLELK